jgi:sec-independent protein translocase protein TatA
MAVNALALSPAPLAVTFPGGWELIIILFIVLLLFGAKRLPDLAGSMGRSLREFRRTAADGAKGPDASDDASGGDEGDDGPAR